MEQFIIQMGVVYIIGWLITSVFNISKHGSTTFNKITAGVAIVCPLVYLGCGIREPDLFKYIGWFATGPMMIYLLYQMRLGFRWLRE